MGTGWVPAASWALALARARLPAASLKQAKGQGICPGVMAVSEGTSGKYPGDLGDFDCFVVLKHFIDSISLRQVTLLLQMIDLIHNLVDS